jgi:hypothetical protein
MVHCNGHVTVCGRRLPIHVNGGCEKMPVFTSQPNRHLSSPTAFFLLLIK